MTSRVCRCSDPPEQMHVIDMPPVPEFDATPFVNYQTDEFTTPTETELVETLPNMPVFEVPAEKPLRRGKGYLRAEISENEAPAPTDEQEDFGAGIDEEEPQRLTEDVSSEMTSDKVSEPAAATETDSDRSQEDKPGKRRRRRRRRKPRGDRSDDTRSEGDGTEDNSSPAGNGSETEEEAAEGGDQPKRKKRRRNRRRRGRGKSDGSEGPSSGDSHSGSPSDTAG